MEPLKQKVIDAIDQQREHIIEIGEEILRHPELGYKEAYASAVVKREFYQLGLHSLSTPAITGVKAWLKPPLPKKQPAIAVMGELDAVLSCSHPYADSLTGAAHACGHNAQIAAMIGCAIGLKSIAEELDGDVCFLATPAEELIELEYRKELQNNGIISYFGGKQQMIAEGVFDDIDMAMMVHAESGCQETHIVTDSYSTGFIGKTIRFIGKESHAGGAPWDGINALNAASLALQAIHTQRETFREEDHVRIHPIITKGGDLVNTVPCDVRMESYVRAGTTAAMAAANEKVNRAILGSAYIIGAEAKIEDIPGYLPLDQNKEMSRLFAENSYMLLPEASIEKGLPFCGSTDAGDLSFLLPLIQPTVSGFSGALHSKDFSVDSKELAYLVPSKLMALTVIDLLKDQAKKSRDILQKYPKKHKDTYINLWKSLLNK